MAYSVTLSKNVQGSTLVFEERVLFNGVDVGGFSLTFAPALGTPQKAYGRTVTRNVLTATLLDQAVDVTYGGEVVAHATFKSTPPVPPDTVHGLECSAWNDRSGDLPMVFSCDDLPPA